VHRAILHLDMDAFYASVEQRDNPQLRNLPLIVGGHPTRGVVLAASYEVRKFGVHSAMPMSRAIKLAPHATVVPPRFSAYAGASAEVFSIFESVTPLVEPLSLDEAFLDVTASQSLFGSPAEIALKLRRRIRNELSLPCSAGIAPSKLVAKLASDFAKPDGQKEVGPNDVLPFLAELPVGRLWGVGAKTLPHLQALGYVKVGDIARQTPERLERQLGPLGRHLWEQSLGKDERDVIPDRQAKSIGAEDTFDEDVSDLEILRVHIHAQALRVGQRLRRAQLSAHGVQLKLKYANFERISRQLSLPEPTDDGQTLYRSAMSLLARVALARPVRLTGVSAHGLTGGEGQLPLFSEAKPQAVRARALNSALDSISEKYGRRAVLPADVASEE
jgi:DNA polymerase-4